MEIFKLVTLTLVIQLFIFIDLSECMQTIRFCDKVAFESVLIPRSLMITKEPQEFRVETGNVLSCPNSKRTLNTTISSPTFSFYPTGFIVVPHQDYFLREDFCISRFDGDIIEIQHCDVQCNITHICIYKCCPPNTIVDPKGNLSDTNSYCVTSKEDNYWRPIFYDAHEGCGIRTKEQLPYHLRPVPLGPTNVNIFPYKHVHTKHGRLHGTRFRLMRNGHIITQNSKNKWTKIQSGEFCIDGMAMSDESNNFLYSGQFHEQLFFDFGYFEFEDYTDTEFNDTLEMMDGMNDTHQYYFDEFDKSNDSVDYFYIILLLIGATFLLASSVLYLLTWEKHNIHAFTIFAYVTTMLFMFIFLATAKILSITENSEFGGTWACKSIGILAHFFYLSTMCWLTIINVDLWLTFRNVKPASSRRQNFARFGFYSIFALGCPILIVGFAVILDSVYLNGIGDGSECVPPYILPLYGEEQCYIQKDAFWPWLYAPIAILMGCNIITFSSTVFSLVRYRKTTRNTVAHNSHQNKDSIILFAKLFVVAGISWTFELLSNTGSTHWKIWILFDCYNLLQAILIFIIFALKRENVIYLYQKYPIARGLLRPALKCCYSDSFDPERTEMTGVSCDRTRFHSRKGSTASTTRVLSSRISFESDNGFRRDSETSMDNKNMK